MKRIVAIFSALILLTIASFAILWAVNPKIEQENTLATQGIRLIGSAVVYTQSGLESPQRVKVGDLLIGSNEQIFRINEIRKGQTDRIYVVVSWKYITDYSSYDKYQAEPYSNYATYELNSFAFNKSIITNEELIKFFADYSASIEQQLAQRREASSQPPPAAAAQPAPTAPVAAPLPTRDTPPKTNELPRSKLRATNQETMAYSVAEVKNVEDLTTDDERKIESLNSEE